MFIETEGTPNPATLKFLPGREVMGGRGTADFTAAPEAEGRSPLAARVFAVGEVARVFLGNDFITVTKAECELTGVTMAVVAAGARQRPPRERGASALPGGALSTQPNASSSGAQRNLRAAACSSATRASTSARRVWSRSALSRYRFSVRAASSS